MISFLDLLTARGYVHNTKRAKLVRHKDSRFDVEGLRDSGWLEVYQKYQSKPIFDGCDYIVVFIGEDGFTSRFIGLYSVGPRKSAADTRLPSECPFSDWTVPENVYYALTKCSGFEDLEDRVVIDWGKAALAWHQWFTSDRVVIEVRQIGRALPPFRDYLRVNLTHNELITLMKHPNAHKDWIAGLSAVGGIYLIVNSLTGEQYVGSATGTGGLWQRWCEYANTGHGNNLRLKELCAKDQGCPATFKFSILETFSRSLSRDEAISLESFFKLKLGTRAFGLNAN